MPRAICCCSGCSDRSTKTSPAAPPRWAHSISCVQYSAAALLQGLRRCMRRPPRDVPQAKPVTFPREIDGVGGDIRPRRRQHQLHIGGDLSDISAALKAGHDLDKPGPADEASNSVVVEFPQPWSGGNAGNDTLVQQPYIGELEDRGAQ